MEYKKYNPSHLQQVVDLLNISFPGNKISKKTFIWKHHHNFFNQKTRSMVAIDEGTVCSFVCFAPIIIEKKRRVFDQFYSCAVQATHPNYQRQGLVSKLTQEIEKELGSDINYIGFSNAQGVKIDKFSKKINYQVLGQMVNRYVFSLPYKADLVVKEINYKSLNLESTNLTNKFSIQKDKSYLDWRYMDNPKSKYNYFQIKKGSTLLGYLVCRKGKMKYSVVEILLNKFDSLTCKQVIKAFSKYAFSQGKFIVSYSYLKNNFWNNSFPFLSSSRHISTFFTVKSVNNDLLNNENWIIQGGDIQ
jgi:hypothetical protein